MRKFQFFEKKNEKKNVKINQKLKKYSKMPFFFILEQKFKIPQNLTFERKISSIFEKSKTSKNLKFRKIEKG